MKPLHATLVLVVALLAPARAYAITHFLNANARPAPVTVWENGVAVNAVYAIVGHGESRNYLAWKKPESDWQMVPYPSGVSSMYEVPGLSAVSFPNVANRQPELYMMSVATSSGIGTLPASTLWRYVHSGGWTQIGSFSRATGQTGTPALAAGRRLSTNEVWVAVRPYGLSSTGTGIYACHTGATLGCTEVHCDSFNGTCASPAIDSPVAIDFATIGTAASEDLFAVESGTGRLLHYRYAPTTSVIRVEPLGVPSDPSPSTVAASAISVWPGDGSSTTMELLVAGKTGSGAPAGTPAFTMQLVSLKIGAPDTWSWLHVLVPGSGSNDVGVDPGVGNLFEDRDPSGTRRLWAIDGRANLQGCLLASLSNTATQNCYPGTPPSLVSNPADIRPNVDRIGPAFAVRNETLWINASLGYTTGSTSNPEYLYSRALTAGGSGPVGQWRNHLGLPGGAAVNAAGTWVVEYTGAERFGTIVVMGVDRSVEQTGGGKQFARVWRSTDDGNTWATWPAAECTSPTQPGCTLVFPVTNASTLTSDPSVTVTAGGEFFVATPEVDTDVPTDSGWVALSHFDAHSPTPHWTAPWIIAKTDNRINDRPWFVADRSRDRTFHLSYSTDVFSYPARTGEFTTCTEALGANCVDGAGDGWCDPIELRSKSGCAGDRYEPRSGCPVSQLDDGSLFVAVQDDLDCPRLVSGYPPSTLDSPAAHAQTSGIGIRRISIPTNGTCPTSTDLGAPACLYVVRSDLFSQVSTPGNISNWTLDLVATEDGSNGLFAVTKSLVDSAGNPCFDSSGTCSGGVFVAYRDPSTGNWCGTTCSSQLTPSGMVRVDSPVSGQNPLLPSLAVFDNGQFEVSWLDFLLPGTSSTYSPASRTGAVNASSHTLGSLTSVLAWHDTSGSSVSSSFVSPYNDSTGDFDHAASARLHAHSFTQFYVSGTGNQWMHRISSPVVQW